MQYQKKSYWCGIASVQAALRVLGEKKSQSFLAGLCAVTSDSGTDETEVKRMILATSHGLDEFTSEDEHEAMVWLEAHLNDLGPVVLCLDEWDHWCCAIGRCGESFIVFDPANSAENRSELGIRVYSWVGLRTRWGLPKRSGGPEFYGIGVSE